MEILVKTLTRHRDSLDPLYMKDWTAFDVCQIMPDGYFTKNKYGGAKKMGIVLIVEGDVPKDYISSAIFETYNEYDYAKLETIAKERMVRRSNYIVDLSKLLSDEKIKDCFNHELLVDPVKINASYLDLFIQRTDRTELHAYDKSGSFASGTVDVGPNGDADANTFYEFESNCAATLTGPLTGNTDEGGWYETATVSVSGISTTATNTLTFSTSGEGRHNGKWDSSAHYIEVQDALAFTTSNLYYGIIDGLQCKRTYVSTQYGSVMYFSAYSPAVGKFKSCIAVAEGHNHSFGCNGDADLTLYYYNCLAYGGSRTGFNGVDAVNIYCYNCTAAKRNGASASYGYSYIDVVKNCIAAGTTMSDFSNCTTVDYCASDDGTGDHAQTLNSTSNYAAEFTDYVNNDFSLVSGSCCVGNGVDDPGSGLYSDDIIGTTRTSTWDIGAFEYVASGGNSYTAAGSLSSAGVLSRMIHVARTYSGELMEWTKQLFNGWRQYVFNSMAQNFSEGR